MKSKITLVYRDIEGNIAEELLWSIKLKNGFYKIDNIPFFAPNIALGDIISVEEDEGVLYFDELIEYSGHSTIQVIFLKNNSVKDIIKSLESLGCKWEGMKDKEYYAIDVPPNVEFKKVKIILDNEFNKGNLDYKEACLSQSID